MSNQATEKGWILHSLAQSRRYGPMTEDELRGYFRAGMVKSVDRLTAPGDYVMRPAAEVAAMLGETVPVGPPPPELSETPAPAPSSQSPLPSPSPPSMAAGTAKEMTNEERAARAAAAMNIDIAALMATSAPAQRRSGWLLPTVAVGALVLFLLVGLNMLRKMKSPAAQVPDRMVYQPPSPPQLENAASAQVVAGTDAPQGPQVVVDEGAGAGDPEFDSQVIKAEQLQNTRDWAGLAKFAQAWAASRPERNEPLQYLGIAYSGLGDYKQAVEPLQKVFAREPANTQARSLLADAYLQSERWTDAAALYKEMVAASPRDARLWNNYGAALNASGQQPLAVAALETAVRLDPTFKQAWTNLAHLYQTMGDTARAEAAAANAR